MNQNDLIQAVYKGFPTSTAKYADRAFQKRIGRTRYFINVYYYDWLRFRSEILSFDAFECDLQFRTPDGDYINVEFPCTKLSVEELEAKVEKIFIALECSDYED